MGAPTGDSILKPVVFLVCLLGTFLVVTTAMSDTIASNRQTTFHGPDSLEIPDYMTLFQNASYSWWTPNPYHVNGSIESVLVHDHPLGDTGENELVKFTNPSEVSHPITVWAVDKWFGETTRDRHEFYFYQHGGTLGLDDYSYLSRFPEDYTYFSEWDNDTLTVIEWYETTIYLRHAYTVLLTGNYTGPSVYTSILAWHCDLALYHISDGSVSADPWTIVAQFFTFSLPGIPLWLNVLLMVPIMAGVGVVAYVLIRGALPA